MSIIEHPVIYTPARDSAAEEVGMVEQQKRRIGAAERETLYAYVAYIACAFQPFGPSAEIFYGSAGQVFIYQVGAGSSRMARRARVCNYMDYSLLAPPLLRPAPAVHHILIVRTAINFHMHRVKLGAVEVFRIDYAGVHGLAILRLYGDYLRQSKAVGRSVRFENTVFPFKSWGAGVREPCAYETAILGNLNPVGVIFCRSNSAYASVRREFIERRTHP